MKVILEHVGGIGDAILDTACIKKLKEKHPEYEIDLLTSYDNAEIFFGASYLNKIYPVPLDYCVIDMNSQLKNKYHKHIHVLGILSWAFFTQQKTLFEQRKELYNVDASPDDIEIILDDDKLPDDFFKDFNISVVFSAPHNQAIMSGKTIHKSVWEQIFDTFKNITFIQVGSNKFDINFDERNNLVDLKDKISIKQTLSTIPLADFVIGCDNFLNHASRAFNKRGIFIFGANDPKQYGWEQNINLYNKKHCSPCLINHDKHTCCFSAGIDNIPFEWINTAIQELI